MRVSYVTLNMIKPCLSEALECTLHPELPYRREFAVNDGLYDEERRIVNG